MKKSNELFVIYKDGKYGYIDRSGRIVIKPQYDNAKRFYDGMAIVNIGGRDKVRRLGHTKHKAKMFVGGKWGYIDTKGNYLIVPQFNCAERFSEGKPEVRSEIVDPNTLQMTFNNVNAPTGYGTLKPFPAGTIEGKQIYLQYRIIFQVAFFIGQFA